MFEVTLEELSCNETADANADNCRMEVYLDDNSRREPYSLRRPMVADGPDWTIDRTFWFDRSIELELHAENWLFPDDWFQSGHTVDLKAGSVLGSAQLPGSGPSSGSGSVSFQYEGSDYELTYSIDQPPGPLKPVDEALEAFRKSSKSGEWTWVDPEPLKDRIEHFVTFAMGKEDPGTVGPSAPSEPFDLDQGGTPFCGPAGIAFALAVRQPRRFVEMVRSLYEQGEFLGREYVGHTSRGLRYASVPDEFTSWLPGVQDKYADWMLITAIRESAHLFTVGNNWFLRPPEELNIDIGSTRINPFGFLPAVHMNIPWTVAHWAEDVLGFMDSTWYSTSNLFAIFHALFLRDHHPPEMKSDAVQMLRDIEADYNDSHSDGYVSLLVSGNFPQPGEHPCNPPPSTPDSFWATIAAYNPFQAFHWVALGGPVDITNDEVKLEYHDSRCGDKLSYNFTHEEFNNLVWGAVAGGLLV